MVRRTPSRDVIEMMLKNVEERRQLYVYFKYEPTNHKANDLSIKAADFVLVLFYYFL